MFEISKYKDSNVKLSIRLPESIDKTLRRIAEAEDMSYNNVLVSCIKYALDNADLSKYEEK
jgi:predicted transcriptional regulator